MSSIDRLCSGILARAAGILNPNAPGREENA